jgi:polysaccharide export outer membrane protein
MVQKLLISLCIIFFTAFCFSCSTKSNIKPGQEMEISKTMFGKQRAGLGNTDIFPVYRIMPGDVLDLLFQIAVSSDKDFKLMPQDNIEIKFPDLPDLNQEQRIRPDGKITLPYIGEVKAVGYMPKELEKTLKLLYSEILNDPELYIVVKEYGAKIHELKESIRNSPRGQSKLIRVRSDGYATFPIVGEVKVYGETFSKITKILNEKFHEVTEDIRIDLLLHESAGAQVCIIGAVQRPGFYPINKPVTIIEALSLAGGYRDDAKLETVLAIRRDGDKMRHHMIDLTKILASDPEVFHTFITMNDIVYVPRTRLSHAAQTAREIGDMIFYNGWSGVSFSYDLNGED